MDNQKILERIKKCLALANSNNVNEASTAMRQAQLLMKKHGIDQETIDVSAINEFRVKSKIKSRIPKWYSDLVILVSAAFQTKPLHSSFNSFSEIAFIGNTFRPEVSGYAFKTLLRTLERNKKTFIDNHEAEKNQWRKRKRKLKRGQKITLGRQFCEGWVFAVESKVDEFAERICANDELLIEKYLQLKNSDIVDANISNSTIGKGKVSSAVVSGYMDGKKVELNPGMTTEEQHRISHV